MKDGLYKEKFKEKDIPEPSGPGGIILKPDCPVPAAPAPPPSQPCLPATYTNGAAFQVVIASGTQYEAPPIAITQVDGTVDPQPANTPVFCQWKSFEIRNSQGFSFKSVGGFPGAGFEEIADIPVTDDNGFVQNVPAPGAIVVDGEIDSISMGFGVVIIKPLSVAPTNIIYRRPVSTIQTTIRETGDAAWQAQQGLLDYNPPAGQIARLDFSAPIPFQTLVDDNIHGNKARFTADNGDVSTQSLQWLFQSFDWDNIVANGGTRYILEDHLTGLDWITVPILNNASWGLTTFNAIAAFTYGGHSDWRMPTVAEMESVIYRQSQVNTFSGSTPFVRDDFFTSPVSASFNQLWTSNWHTSSRAILLRAGRLFNDFDMSNTPNNGVVVCRNRV